MINLQVVFILVIVNLVVIYEVVCSAYIVIIKDIRGEDKGRSHWEKTNVTLCTFVNEKKRTGHLLSNVTSL